MKKDAYYFPHYSNARNDAKLIKLRRVLGIEGYGIYFMILEVLRDQTDFSLPIDGVEDLAFEWHTSKEKIYSVINDYGLFDIDGESFRSDKLILYLQPYIEKSERARAAANLRWDAIRNANAYANALPKQCGSNADQNASKVKESKVKESKEEKESIDFDVFWNLYDDKKGRKKCVEKWNKLSFEDHKKIIETLPDYKNHKPFESYNHPYPLTYLNGELWKDPIPTGSKWNNISELEMMSLNGNEKTELYNHLVTIPRASRTQVQQGFIDQNK